MATFSCLIVEDDQATAEMVSLVVQGESGASEHCASLRAAEEALRHRAYDVVVLDNHLPDGKAYDRYAVWSRQHPDTSFVMVTGMPAVDEAVRLTRNGLFEYLTKPADVEVLAGVLRRAVLRARTRAPMGDTGDCVGISAAMAEVRVQLQQAARHPEATVLLTGESGTGKDAAARLLHRLTYGDGGKDSYVPVNCAAIPQDVFESELFGAERGAFTGADRKRIGLVGAAREGTLFLDEIGDVPTGAQAKLLRLLEGREYRSVGGEKTQSFSGRFVAATNKELASEVKAGRFREDLMYRLEVFPIRMPSLRERPEDVPVIAEHLLRQLAVRYRRKSLQLRQEDLEAMMHHDFPGNVRELRNILERGLLRSPPEANSIQIEMPRGSGGRERSPGGGSAPGTVVTPPGRPVDASGGREGLSGLEAREYEAIQGAMVDNKGAIRRAAASLGISPQALLRRLEKWPELRVNR